eukprot:scaffold71594_cov69-Phaeocystis_antarctica.AAC.1
MAKRVDKHAPPSTVDDPGAWALSRGGQRGHLRSHGEQTIWRYICTHSQRTNAQSNHAGVYSRGYTH